MGFSHGGLRILCQPSEVPKGTAPCKLPASRLEHGKGSRDMMGIAPTD